MADREDLVRYYFSLGLEQQEILGFLNIIHNMPVSPRTLKRILKKMNLTRRINYTNLDLVVSFVQDQINKSGQLCGYRWMHLKCIQHGLVVNQEVVRELLSILDPVGVEMRKKKRLRRREYYSKGPNWLWHLDSYDKLKPYGICINGCVDGFSRHIIWLRAGSTSSDSKVIAGYYLDSLKALGGCPKTVRADLGTENKLVERFQNALKQLFYTDENQRPAFMVGKSTGNQRIESWWAILRKNKSQYWMNMFEILKNDGFFNGTFLDKSLLQFCFMEIIQDELDQVAYEWNTHRIQRSRNRSSPKGRPFIMYELPNIYGTMNYLTEIPLPALEALELECTFLQYPCDKDVFDLCNILLLENNYHKSKDPYSAIQLYLNLRRRLYTILS